MSHTLTKTTDTVYRPGTGGTPPFPGSPGRTVTSIQTVCGFIRTSGTGLGSVLQPGDGHQAGDISGETPPNSYIYKCAPRKVTTVIPPIPPKPGTPGTAPTTTIDYHLGWNSGGRSVLFFAQDGYTEFHVRTSVVGVIAGLNVADTVDAKYLGNNIDYAFYCARGISRIQENGRTIMGVGPYSDATVFRIERVGSDIVYSMDGTVRYTNVGGADPMQALRLETSMYSGGDEVFDPTIVQISPPDLSEQSGTIDSVLPALASTIFGGGFMAEMKLKLPALVTRRMEAGIAAPSFAILGAALPPLYTRNVYMMTGEIGQIDASLPPLDMLAADHPYGEMFLKLLPPVGMLLAYEGNTNASMGGEATWTPRFDAPTHVVVRMDSHGVITDAFLVGTTAHALMQSTAAFTVVLDLQSLLNATMLSRILWSGGVAGKNPVTGADSGNETWAVNVDNNGSTTYDNYEFNSYALIGDEYYGANERGIFLLAGKDDDGVPIRASVDFGTVRFSKTEKKTVESCYVGMAADGYLYLKIIAEGQEYVYRTRDFSPEMQMQRVTPGKGLRTNYVTLQLFNENGDDFEVDAVKFMVADMKRRI